ncbi:energy transducer TonB [Neisseria perflava]|uniref:energy transducer TonB n=1 Tax=Neisseria perflava TaxID=33053 RepID=UPI00209D147B|nr:energy transducer TonB [Neisseria perflava]MCP1660133.1 TonB family protein [Neisseria perflava]
MIRLQYILAVFLLCLTVYPARASDNPPIGWLPKAQYPPHSVHLREQGVARVRIYQDENGNIEATLIKSSGYPRLDEAALKAARRAKLKPTIQDGKIIPKAVNVPFRFKL